MRVEKNTAVHFGEVLSPREKEEAAKEAGKQKKTVFAGNLNMPQDPIAKKREEARNRAMQVVKNAYHNDREVDLQVEDNCNKASELRKSIAETKKNISEINEQLKEAEGMEDGEEKERTIADLEAFLKDYMEQAGEEEKEKAKALGIVRATRLERPKMEASGMGGMGDAKKQAEEILESASKEIMGMLVDEAKDYMDEMQKEQEEKGEKLAEKQEEMEQFIEETKEKREEREEMMELTKQAVTMDQLQEDVKTEIANIVDKMKLVAEDVKGTVVDEQI